MKTSSTSNATRVLAREPLAFEALPAQVRANVLHDVLFSVLPAHPSNQLRIERASNGREQSPVRAWPYDRDPVTGAQRFRAQLPPVAVDEMVEYKPVLTPFRGLVVMELPARTTWGVGAATVTVPTAPDRTPPTAVPRYEWASEFLGAFTVQLAKPPESVRASARWPAHHVLYRVR